MYRRQQESTTLELGPTLPTKDSPEFPTPSNRWPTNTFRPYDLPDIPPFPSPYDHELPHIISSVQQLQPLAPHAHSEKDTHISGCIVCGKYLQLAILNSNTTYHSSFGCEESRTLHGGVPYSSTVDHKLGVKLKTSSVPTTDFSDEKLKRTQILYNKTNKKNVMH